MTITVTPTSATLGAIVTNVDLARLDDATWQEIHDAFLEYALLIFPDQHLNNAEQVRFAERFGALEFDLAPISNVQKDGTVRVGTGGAVAVIESESADGTTLIRQWTFWISRFNG